MEYSYLHNTFLFEPLGFPTVASEPRLMKGGSIFSAGVGQFYIAVNNISNIRLLIYARYSR